MKKTFNYYSLAMITIILCLTQACVDAEDLATPNVASPVLVLLQGSVFAPNASIDVTSTYLELDKTNILDHTKGIDSIPVSALNVKVFINNTQEVASLVTDSQGMAQLAVTWEDLGMSNASSGDQIRLEFAGTHKNVAFRKYHTIRVQ